MQYENCVVQHFGMAKLCNSGVQQKILKANFNFSLNQITLFTIPLTNFFHFTHLNY